MIIESAISAACIWAAAAVAGATCLAAARVRSQFGGGTQFFLMMTAVTFWCLVSGMEAAAGGYAQKVLLSRLDYFGICAVPPLFLSFALSYSGKRRTSTTFRIALFWTMPLLTLLFVFTNNLHHLIWTEAIPVRNPRSTTLLFVHGIWFWVWVGYAACVTAMSTMALMLTAINAARVYRFQSTILLVSAALPWIGTILYLSPRSPFPGFDSTVAGFAASGGLILFGIVRFRLFDVVPVARFQLVDRMIEGLLVLDSSNRVIDLNQAARRIIGIGTESIGRPLCESASTIAQLLGPEGTDELTTSIYLPGDPVRRVDVTTSPLRDGRAAGGGRVLFLRDTVLNSDPVGVDKLLPMCASCRRVRDADGSWLQLEQYVERRLGRHFTHGLCEKCIGELYPELDVTREERRRCTEP